MDTTAPPADPLTLDDADGWLAVEVRTAAGAPPPAFGPGRFFGGGASAGGGGYPGVRPGVNVQQQLAQQRKMVDAQAATNNKLDALNAGLRRAGPLVFT